MSLLSIRVEQRTIQGIFIPYLVVPIMAKVLEKLIANHLSSYLESHSLLHDHQGAYWSGRSSEHILLFAVDTIVHALDRGLAVCGSFLDLRKAFDSLDYVICWRDCKRWEFVMLS